MYIKKYNLNKFDEEKIFENNLYSDRNLTKYITSGYNSKFNPEIIRRKQNLDLYHLKQLSGILKKNFPNEFEKVQIKEIYGYINKYQIIFYVDKPEIKISEANKIERVVKLVPEVRRILDYILRTWSIHIDFNQVSVKNIAFKKNLYEGECSGGIAGDIGGEISNSGNQVNSNSGISSEDVLGKIDLKKGFMGKGDFHIPKNIFGKAMKKKFSKKNSLIGKPKIINYSNLSEKEKLQLKPILVYNLPQNKIEEILDNTKIENKRYCKEQFLKFIDGYYYDIEFVGLFSKFPKECFAMAVLSFNRAEDEDCYIAEIQSFKKGFGQEILLKILKNHKNTWLCCDPTAEKGLLNFYRRPCFNFKEYIVKHSIWDNKAHFFYTYGCNEEKIKNFIDTNYSK